MHHFRVGETVTITVVIDEYSTSSITTTIRAMVDNRIYLDVDGIDIFIENGYITCTKNVNYDTKTKKLCGDFVDNEDDMYSDCYSATITYQSAREDC